MKNSSSVAILLAITLLVMPSNGHSEEQEVFIDAVVASVNGVPITLTDVSKRAGGTVPHSLSEAARDEKIQLTLQQMITEQLLRAEATERRLGVSNEELNRYLERVAEQNGMTIAEFETALAEEHKTLKDYREQVEVDILRTKLAGALMREGITVGENEINQYIDEHPEYHSEGAKLKLRQILIEKREDNRESAIAQLTKIRAGIDSLESFVKAVQEYSEGAEVDDDGLIGVLSEEELSADIFDALFKLKEGSVSDVVETSGGFHLFYLEAR
ncbi:MAG: peptidylprolyl isomerase, partial [Bdellovibrionales bacterium]|nr:peptidylprolyl isomerase [Bdellovibrionales bacterium]